MPPDEPGSAATVACAISALQQTCGQPPFGRPAWIFMHGVPHGECALVPLTGRSREEPEGGSRLWVQEVSAIAPRRMEASGCGWGGVEPHPRALAATHGPCGYARRWTDPEHCGNGHLWGPGRVLLSWMPCQCGPPPRSRSGGRPWPQVILPTPTSTPASPTVAWRMRVHRRIALLHTRELAEPAPSQPATRPGHRRVTRASCRAPTCRRGTHQ
jgi:hypothetical protein